MSGAMVRYFLMIAISGVIAGLIVKVKAVWAGRYGPPVTQPFFDLIRLLRKSSVISRTTSPIFALAPSAALGAVLTAAVVVPIAGRPALIHFNGDFIFFTYALAFGKLFTVFGALDTGSSFEGMGVSREITFSALIEPAFFIIMGSMAMLTGHTSITGIYSMIPAAAYDFGQGGFLASIMGAARAWSQSELLIPAICGNIVLMMTILVEASRMPVDDPTTHLELTMVHEVMVLDTSGPDLGFINAANMIKITLLGTLITGIIIPQWVSPLAGVVLYLLMLTLIAISIGLLESTIARLRMTHVPQFILGATSVALIVLAVLMLGVHK
ncbi:respiratory chain complex I subunit 1 family protein [Candidatus Magnetominusculus xianensis]|uniref:Hydrogenase n=1 Tax=Candidatus Magnetominusculus xianensis TaxID=1748249 RepID=A0ABR5SEU4_9BACT|nr:NADH-quinone oxidoreductase subunit H [Candidatus Magnetominusculus xianensis]KWT85081.1 hydrogenase [Candidatus Magnetominusculus xianensis]MBF0402458.1 NADH-quinone oxidoreductase subunit H [Nitrospirota bacterium]